MTMTTLSKLVAFAITVAAAGTAAAEADPRFEVVDRGDAVEVIGHGMTAVGTLRQVRERLEIELAGTGSIDAKRQEPTDATVRLMEISGRRTMSVKLRLERPEVKAISAVAKVAQVGDDVHLIFPRRFASDAGTVNPLPEPTTTTATQAPKPTTEQAAQAPIPAANIEENPAPAPDPTAAITAPTTVAPTTNATNTTNAANAAPTSPTPTTEPAPPATPAKVAKKTDSNLPNNLVIMAGLAFIAAGLWVVKRRKAKAAPAATIDVVAQRALGGKAKVVWLSAGDREMVVAVTPQNVRMLGQWKKADADVVAEYPVFPAAPRPPRARTNASFLPEAHALPSSPPPAPGRNAYPRAATNSPAVQGILKLRERAGTVQPPPKSAAEEDMEADMVWAREILEATGGRV
jgi:flagellar biogenesis protein FliO